MTTPIVAAVCTYERHDLLRQAIGSLVGQTLPQSDYRILVVDNSPPSDRRDHAQQSYSDIANLAYVTVDTPGLSNARNVAARGAASEYIAYLDDDAVAAEDWLEQVLAVFEQFGDAAGIVGGKVEPLWTAPRPAWLSDDMLGSLTVVDLGDVTREKHKDEWIAGANFSVRVEPLLEHGGFDTKLGRTGGNVLLSNEDVAFVAKFEEAGYRTIWAPKAVVSHRVEPERVTQSWFRRRYAWQAVSDFMSDPETAKSRSSGDWRNLVSFFNDLPPRLRTPRGLMVDLDDPGLARRQIGVVYSATALLLAGASLDDLERES